MPRSQLPKPLGPSAKRRLVALRAEQAEYEALLEKLNTRRRSGDLTQPQRLAATKQAKSMKRKIAAGIKEIARLESQDLRFREQRAAEFDPYGGNREPAQAQRALPKNPRFVSGGLPSLGKRR